MLYLLGALVCPGAFVLRPVRRACRACGRVIVQGSAYTAVLWGGYVPDEVLYERWLEEHCDQ